ncbi:Lysozyme RrrD [compost metagenome]
MNLSPNGLDTIKGFEQLRLTAYLDTGGVWTIGYGHTRSALAGMQISEARALMLLAQDVAEAVEAVNKLVRVPLEQYEFDALVSFVFNIGVGAFKSSTMLRCLNDRAEPMRIGTEFLRWVYDNGKKIAGLETRRRKERLLFLGRA